MVALSIIMIDETRRRPGAPVLSSFVFLDRTRKHRLRPRSRPSLCSSASSPPGKSGYGASMPWCITLDNSKGISRLRFWAKNRRVNGINDLPVFMHQGRLAQLLPPRRRIGVRARQLDGTDGLQERSARGRLSQS